MSKPKYYCYEDNIY